MPTTPRPTGVNQSIVEDMMAEMSSAGKGGRSMTRPQIEARVARAELGSSAITTQVAKLRAQLGEFQATTDVRERNRLAEIIGATLETVQATQGEDTKDFAEMVEAILRQTEEFDKTFDDLNKPSAADNTPVTEAEAAIADAKQKERDNPSLINVLNEQLLMAKRSWDWFGLAGGKKSVKVARAQDALTKAQDALTEAQNFLKDADQKLEEAKKQAIQNFRHRIQRASLEESLLRFQTIVKRCIDVKLTRIAETEAQIDALIADREVAHKEERDAKVLLEKKTKQYEETNQILLGAQRELAGYQQNDPRFATANARVSELTTALERIDGEKATALTVAQTAYTAAEIADIALTSQIRYSMNNRTMVSKLDLDMRHGMEIIKARLLAIKEGVDEKLGFALNRGQEAISIANAEDLAARLVVSDKLRLETLKAMEDHLKAVDEIRGAVATHRAGDIEEMMNLYEKFSQRYGTEIMDLFVSTHMSKQQPELPEASPAQ